VIGVSVNVRLFKNNQHVSNHAIADFKVTVRLDLFQPKRNS
jgi:hypothetical protein